MERAAVLKAQSPLQIFKQQMNLIRKKYAQEHAEKILSEKSISLLKAQKQAEVERLQQLQIKEYLRTHKVSIPRESAESRVKLKKISSENHLATLAKHSEHRVDALLSLFHASKDFVTYQNMEQKINDCLADNMKFTKSIEGRLLDQNNSSAREMKLRDIVCGTINGLPGADQISEKFGKKVCFQNDYGKISDSTESREIDIKF